MLRKIQLMHQMFGISEQNKCKDCCHFITERYRGKNYHKCKIYGQTNSEASDFRCSYTACGLYNRPYDGDVEIISIRPKKDAEEPIEGQMRLFE